MWYEILPSALIIMAGLGLPGWGLYHIHNLVLGNHFRRSLNDRWERAAYQRDLRLTGNPYKVNVKVKKKIMYTWKQFRPIENLPIWKSVENIARLLNNPITVTYKGLDAIPDK